MKPGPFYGKRGTSGSSTTRIGGDLVTAGQGWPVAGKRPRGRCFGVMEIKAAFLGHPSRAPIQTVVTRVAAAADGHFKGLVSLCQLLLYSSLPPRHKHTHTYTHSKHSQDTPSYRPAAL